MRIRFPLPGDPAPFEFDRTFSFALDPAALWALLDQPHRYREWWSWLRELETAGAGGRETGESVTAARRPGRDVLSDGVALVPGNVARCVIQAPLPYTLRCAIHIDDVIPQRLVHTTVRGDLDGPARLLVSPTDRGCAVRLSWTLDVRDGLLRQLARLARPLMAWAHDRVVETGLAQFERVALGTR